MSELPAGSRIGRFRIASVLGRGAMGIVYLADDPEIGRKVAIKTVRPEAAGGEDSSELEARFLKEARLAGRLQHPHIVTIYDVGREGGTCFIAMEYVDGRPLTRYLGAAPDLPLQAKVAVVRQVAEALAHAHERGVLHRDIKPGNILIGKDGRVKVTDFGIGKFTGGTSSDLTRTGHMVGSPAYMSPEQIRGEPLDGRSDLFALGVVLYELLTGARPFPGESITTLVYQILHTEPRDPLALRADLPPATREVMARLLAKQPEKRPADAREFLSELKRIARFQRESELTRRAVSPPLAGTEDETEPARPEPASPPPFATRSSLRGGRLALYAALAALAAAAFLLVREARRGPFAPLPAPPGPAPAASPAAAPTPAPTLEPSPAGEPKEAPTEAALVEATAPAPPTPVRARTPRVRPPVAPKAEEKPASTAPAPPPPPAPSKPDRVDAVFATRRAVRFNSSPQQARLYVDDRYIGIADDWDNRGGGRELEFGQSGTHYVRLELPGYRTLTLEIDVTGESGEDSISIDEELERRQKLPFEKLPAPADRTTGAVEFVVEPSSADVSEGGKPLGPASSFGPGSPLRLSGPAVHDLYLSAPGHRPKLVRVLVAPNAGRDRARITEKLKPE